MFCTLVTFHLAVVRCLFGSCRNRPSLLLPSQFEDQIIQNHPHLLHLNSGVGSPGGLVVAATQCPPQLNDKLLYTDEFLLSMMAIFNN